MSCSKPHCIQSDAALKHNPLRGRHPPGPAIAGCLACCARPRACSTAQCRRRTAPASRGAPATPAALSLCSGSRCRRTPGHANTDLINHGQAHDIVGSIISLRKVTISRDCCGLCCQEKKLAMWSMSFRGGTVGMPSKGKSIVAISSNTSACR